MPHPQLINKGRLPLRFYPYGVPVGPKYANGRYKNKSTLKELLRVTTRFLVAFTSLIRAHGRLRETHTSVGVFKEG